MGSKRHVGGKAVPLKLRMPVFKPVHIPRKPELIHDHEFVHWVPTRRDNRFAVQLYVYALSRKDNIEKADVIQLRPNGIQTPLVLKPDVVNSFCAVDEVKGRLYVIQTTTSAQGMLQVHSLSFTDPDAAGFRKASLTQGDAPSDFQFKFGFDDCKVLAPLFILPNGFLVWWVQADRPGRNKTERDTIRNQIAAIVPEEEYEITTSDVFKTSHYPLHEFAVIKQNTQMVVHCHPEKCTGRHSSLFVIFGIEYGESFSVSGPIDRIQPYTTDLLERPFLMFKEIFQKKAQLIGRGYKYWFVGFAKDTSQKLLAVRSKHLSLDCLKEKQPRQVIWSVQQYAAYKAAMSKRMFELVGKNVQLMNTLVDKGMFHAHFEVDTHSRLIISVPLPLGFKDYRVCANCKRQENGKRKDSKGKRTADFKVCRICKSLNLHLRWWKFGCHFCSKQCIDQAWKTHTKMHQMQ